MSGAMTGARQLSLFIACLTGIALTVSADELPRKTKMPRESYSDVDVIYDFVTAPDGKRLRTIITKPHDATGKLPAIFVAGWLSCDSVEAPEGTKDTAGLAFRELAQLRDFCLFRVDKEGVGDSEGGCAENDFESELAGYRAAFRSLRKYDFIDPSKTYPGNQQRWWIRATGSGSGHRTKPGRRLHRGRRLGKDMVRALCSRLSGAALL